MKAILYDAPRSFRYADVADPEPANDEVLIRVKACGVCGTDLHVHEGEFAPRFPLIPGHEFTGEIAAFGLDIRGWTVGDRVVANCNQACGRCFQSRRATFIPCGTCPGKQRPWWSRPRAPCTASIA